MGGLSLVFAGLVACNDDSASHSRANDDPPPSKIDTVKKVDPVTGDTVTEIKETPATIDTVRTIDPVIKENFR